MVEVLQRPGETVFTPAGWPHVVLNLETSVAITHNYATEHGMGGIHALWEEVSQGEPEFAKEWLTALRVGRPDLARLIDDNGPERNE